MKRFLGLILIAAISFWALSAFAMKAPENTPTRAIQDLDEKLDDYKTGPNLSEDDKAYNKKIKEDILHGAFDIKELSRLSLEKHWLPRTYAQRQYFVDLMISLLENKAILSKEQGQKKAKSNNVYTVTYLGESYINKDHTRALARTNVYVRSEDINVKLDYKLRFKGGEWRIYDVILDGASLVENYRYQFDRIIVKNGYPELVRRMERKLNDIKDDDA